MNFKEWLNEPRGPLPEPLPTAPQMAQAQPPQVSAQPRRLTGQNLVAILDKMQINSGTMSDLIRDCAQRGIGPRRIKNAFPNVKKALEAAGIDPFEAYEALGVENHMGNETPDVRKVRNYLYARPIVDTGYGSGESLYDSIMRGLNSGRSAYLMKDLPEIWPKTTATIQQDGYTWESLVNAVKQMQRP